MPSISSTPKALPLGKMIVFITIRVGDAICPRASHFSPSEGTHENPALATCVGGTSWVTLGEQTRVICRECRSFCKYGSTKSSRRSCCGASTMGALHLIKNAPPGAPVPPILPPQNGFLFLDNKAFPAAFAADVDIEKAEFMADSRFPSSLGSRGSPWRDQRTGVEDQAELVS